jgi:hypothetical protein
MGLMLVSAPALAQPPIAVPSAPAYVPPPIPVEISEYPLYNGVTKLTSGETIGAFIYRGSYSFKLRNGHFTELSGATLSPDGKRLALVTDRGSRIVLNLTWDKDKLVSAIPEEMQFLQNQEGKALQWPDNDAEALAVYANGDYLVSFERNHRFSLYDKQWKWRKDIALPKDITRAVPRNGGFEAMTLLPDESILAITEEGDEKSENATDRSFGVKIKDNRLTRFFYQHKEGFRPTDILAIDDTVYLLERSFTPVGIEVKARIASFPIRSIAENAVIKGNQLLELDGASRVDNMEVLVGFSPRPGTRYFIAMSDDNNSPIQNTIAIVLEQKP